MYGILNGHDVEPFSDLQGWAHWFETADCKVERDVIGEFTISTVFLGIDHQWDPAKAPLWFETMIFPKDSLLGVYCERYGNWDEAKQGHREAVQFAEIAIKEKRKEKNGA